jgi:DNA gyrase subunit A
MGRATAGVNGIRPVEGDYVVSLCLVTEDSTLLVASENGIGKRTPFADYRIQSRGGKGIITMKVGEKTGEVVGAVTVQEDDELMLMTTGAQSIRIRVSEIREAGRNTMGVKLVTLKKGEKLQDVARVVPDEDTGEVEDDSDNSEDPPTTSEEPPVEEATVDPPKPQE